MKRIFTQTLYLFALLLSGLWASAQTVPYSTAGTTYTQDFDGLISTGTTNNPANGPFEIVTANFAGSNAPGWYLEKYSGSGTGASFAANDGASNSGSAFSYGATGSTDRALGALASGSRSMRSGVLITNTTGTTLTSISISFYTEMWRKGDNATANTYPFSYKIGAAAVNDATGFVPVSNLNLVTPNIGGVISTPRDGNDPSFRTLVNYTINGVSWASGQTIALRWDDQNETGSDDGLAVDDFNFSAIASASPNLNASPTTLTLANTPVGTPSAALTYSLSGSNLNGSTVTVTAPANFEVSTDGSNFAASQVVGYSAPNLSATISVRTTATAPAGDYVGAIVVNAGGGAPNANVTVNAKVLATEPITQSTNVIISNVANTSFDVNWTNGDGTSRLVTLRAGAAPEVAPIDGNSYTVGGSTGGGNNVVYIGNGSGPISLTGLIPGTTYTVQVYEFNGSAGSSNFNVTAGTNNPASTLTLGSLPNLTQANFTSVATPLYGASGNATRLPVMYYATVSGLNPNTTYRYYTQAGTTTDIGSAFTGAGNSVLIDYTVTPVTYTYTTGGSLSSAGNYGKFTTNASGSFTGAFGYVNTGNARFTAGNVLYPTIAIGEDLPSTNVQYRYALNEGITVLAFGTTNSATEGTFIKGASLANAGNLVGLWQSEDGNNIVAARPLAMTLVENPTFLGAPWAASFVTGYDLAEGAWNTIIPNSNANGVRLIQQFDIRTGAVLGCNSDADGTWPDGAITANPTGGVTPLTITSADAPIDGGVCYAILPISMTNFAVQKVGSVTRVGWTTLQEMNSKEFVIERSTNSLSWIAVGSVAAAGNSSQKINYTFVDNSPAKGINYYRIRSVDIDNKFSNSAIKSVLFSNADVVVITPNPATSFVNIYMSKTNNSLSQIIVTDGNGKLVDRIRTAEQTYQLQTSRYSKGVYVIRVIGEDNTSIQKVIIQ
ncbi:MAG: T9SS type A sorting domain-containing protein [Sphingobacteriales bacterium]|nr:MAG: T9SS type A sorting domain-containing protein [Sphingobacteriales bacterium]